MSHMITIYSQKNSKGNLCFKKTTNISQLLRGYLNLRVQVCVTMKTVLVCVNIQSQHSEEERERREEGELRGEDDFKGSLKEAGETFFLHPVCSGESPLTC